MAGDFYRVMNVLILGCGSKWGRQLLDSLASNHTVYSISSQDIHNVNNLKIDWSSLGPATVEKFLKNLPDIDLVFFNQNGSALSGQNFDHMKTIDHWKLEKHWSQQYYNSVIFPFHVVQSINLNKDSIVAWMLSSYVYQHINIDHADYVGNKYQNFVVMKNFSKTGKSCFCGVNPMDIDNPNVTVDKFITNLFEYKKEELNGNVIYFNGEIDLNFKTFSV